MNHFLLKLRKFRPDEIGHGVADGRGRIGQKLYAPCSIKPRSGAQQANAALLDQIFAVHTEITLGKVHASVQFSGGLTKKPHVLFQQQTAGPSVPLLSQGAQLFIGPVLHLYVTLEVLRCFPRMSGWPAQTDSRPPD